MHTLSSRAAIAPLISVLLLLLPPPLRDRVDANEFPSQPATRQSPHAQPLRKPDAIFDRARATEIRVVRTPDVVGQGLREAKAKLEGAGLRAGPEMAEPTRGARPGTVVRQSPAAGTPIKPGAAISLWVSAAPPGDGRRSDDVGSPTGPRTPPRGDGGIRVPDGLRFVVVPDLGRRSVPEALSILERARLRVGIQHREESEAPAGEILGQAPAAGARVPVGTAVSVTIATPMLVEVPDVLGRAVLEVAEQLQRSRLGLGPQQPVESDLVAGTVVSQTPGAGQRVPVGSSIAVTVARPILVTVPDVRGTAEADAVARLHSGRLRAGDRSRRESDDTAGTIVDQRPAPGTRVSPGTLVSLAVAVPSLVSVPDLSGRTDDEARQILRERQLVLGERERQESDARPGSITTQSPRADTRVPRGTRIDVVVAVAPPITPVVVPQSPQAPPPKPQITPPSPQKPQAVDRRPRPTPRPLPNVVAPVPSVSPTTTVALTPPATGEAPARVASATPVVPVPATSSPARQFDWLYLTALTAALVLVLGGARVAWHRYSERRAPSLATVPVPTLAFAPHWDVGIIRIGPAGALCAGPGLRLVPGMDMEPAQLDNEHIVDVATLQENRDDNDR